MALPPGITPKTVTIGVASFTDGTIADGTVTITAPVNLIHTPTNRPIFSSAISQRFVDGVATFNLCPTDAAGLNRVDWTYSARITVSGALVQPDPIWFTLPTAGPDTVDLDGLVTVPSSAGIPISVDVLTTEDLPPLVDDGGPFSEALRAALGAVPWIPAEAVTAGKFRLSPSGQIIQRNADGTTRGSYDATEQAAWTPVSGGGGGAASLTPTATKTAAYTAAVGDLAMMNVAGGATVLTLPTAPADKAQVGYRAIGATAAVPLTVNAGSGASIGTTGATSAVIALADEVAILQYQAASTRWLAVSNVKTQASLDTKYGPRGQTIALLGDSITFNINPANAFASPFNNDGYWTWASMILRQRVRCLGVFGYSGQTIPTIATHVPEVLATNPKFVFVLAGTNSVTAGHTLAQMQTDMKALLAPLLSAGCRVLVGTIPPLAAWTTPQQAIAYGFNRWLVEYGYANGVEVVDWSSALADPATGLPASGVLADGVHPNALGASKMGKRLANALTPLLAATDVQGAGGDPGNLLVNGSMVAGSPIATGWGMYSLDFGTSGSRAGAVASKVARTDDVPGFWQQFAVTDSAGVFFIANDITTGWAVGDKVQMTMEFDRDNNWTMTTAANAFRLTLECRGGSGFDGYGMNHIAGQTYPTANLPLNGVITTPVFTIPAGTTALRPEIEFNGQGTLRIGRCEVRKIIAP